MGHPQGPPSVAWPPWPDDPGCVSFPFYTKALWSSVVTVVMSTLCLVTSGFAGGSPLQIAEPGG